MSYQEHADYQLLSVYTRVEASRLQGICIFCGKTIYQSQTLNRDHGYVALYQGREVVMHGSCGKIEVN